MTKAVKSEFITILKNTSRAISNESSTSSDSSESTPVDGSGVIAGTTTETSHKLIELLSSKDKVYSALASIHEPGKEYDSVSGDTKELWGFVVRRVLKMVLPKSEVGSIYSGKTPVTKELLMDKVGVSDEAMVWTIIMAKTEEILEEAKIGESGSAISNMASDSIGGGRKGNRRGGRKQRKRDSDGKILASNKFDAEVGNHQAAYEQFYGRITRSRSSNGGYNDDGNGWYDAAVEKLNVMRNENQSDSLQGTGNTGICPAILAVFTSADGDKENQVGAGFSECAIAMDLIQQRCEV
ncbi:expressed unknown protein [Seminavis robusta]|uniref:Uncharacterized protein n=1 Tax=Seminavis robusta TaxID=568900 RepID=A0A9N8HAT4_9STRA|nr:expressed unknown protein [Seminavis robusta]|eukprot:Sro253_g099750.1 n/a (296) ;mRNA; f:9124-10176